MVTFHLHAKDPNGEFVHRQHRAAIYPRIGDTLPLWDGTGWQGIQVDDVILYPDGVTVEVWAGGKFTGWDDGSVERLFESAGALH